MCPHPPVDTAPLRARDVSRLERRGLLAPVAVPLHRLQRFSTVDDQLSLWGISFEGAIAILPSNPNFYTTHPKPVVMPRGQRRSLIINFQKPHQKVTLRVRGYRDISLSALDAEGHCIVHGKTFRHRLMEQQKAPLEQITVELGSSQQLVLESPEAFVLESLQLWAA